MGVFTMPSLGADMEAGTLVEWLVQPGDKVKRGDVVAVVETQKGAIEVEIFETGTVGELLAQIGQTLPVGAALARIDGADEATPRAPAGKPAPRAMAPAPEATPQVPPPKVPTQAGASPAARHRARDLGVDLARLQGSGPGGAVVLADVEAAATGAQAAPRDPKRDPMRDAIAAAMTRSKQTIPHFYVTHRFDVEPLTEFLAHHNAHASPDARILFGAAVVRATALACRKVPRMNGTYDTETGFAPSQAINIGIAIALRGGGLVVPAIRDCGDLDLTATMQAMRDLVTRARVGRLRSSEVSSPTITVSALGDRGAETMTGVIFPPQVALVGVGAPQRRPWALGDRIVPRQVLTVSLSADHRVVDGRLASDFLMALEALLHRPEDL